MNPVAYLIYATASLAGFPAKQWTAIAYPSLPICEAKAREFNAFEARPDQVAARSARQVTIVIAPHCVLGEPQLSISEPPP